MTQLKKILLAEDDPNDVELTLTALSEHNLANGVSVARDGEETLDYLYMRGRFKNRTPGNPILILLDVKMPKLNGIQVLKTIKNDDDLKNIPVVMLTSSEETRDISECYNYGVNAYVVKPVNFSDFISAVKELGIFWAMINITPDKK
ncbi:MAG TPA: response regulator [Ignavibacteriales bacterium]|nr:response regulator [Ignavibacteriales bacterium]